MMESILEQVRRDATTKEHKRMRDIWSQVVFLEHDEIAHEARQDALAEVPGRGTWFCAGAITGSTLAAFVELWIG